jgi:hypothetical protein
MSPDMAKAGRPPLTALSVSALGRCGKAEHLLRAAITGKQPGRSAGAALRHRNSISIARLMKAVTLYRPVGSRERQLIEETGWTMFPPRLPEQPIFYPVMNEDYAIQIARNWNVRDSGSGFVTRFEVEADFVQRYPVQKVRGSLHMELWVPAEELDEFNRHIVGKIESHCGVPSLNAIETRSCGCHTSLLV